MYWYRTTVGAAQIAFTNRQAGNLALHVNDDEHAVRRRRTALEADLGVAAGSMLFLNQVHGVAVADADALQPGEVPVADAAVSVTGRALAVMVADCVPVVLVGTTPENPALCVTAVAHAGRNGLLDGVLEATVTAMQDRGAETITAVVGPSVCGRCYEVPPEMAEDSEAIRPGIRSTTSWGTTSLDLPSAAVQCLETLGASVQRPQVADSPACTLENPGLSSHRRDPGSGRIVGVVTTAPTEDSAAAPAGAKTVPVGARATEGSKSEGTGQE
ncbi:polyphenol oxidase family protein [Kocuria sp.]|uniref:polyphenol oxidase family protein n=1 Tax=Kocuria sp. TaxID=1871328 RepID=UPI0026DEB16B|nr:polyphenol oxidase family protein [Kocuria sp.]MDO5618447.1 polyphenol oxidase family protein [Kocuria sp.]